MILDSQLSFVPIGAALSLVSAVLGDAIPSTNTVDLMGSGVGTAPPNIMGTATLFGTDMGIGAIRPELNAVVGTACTAGTGTPTLNTALQAAADLGTPTYQPDTWYTLAETGAVALANLTAGARVARFPVPLPAAPEGLRPRYLRLLFTMAAATSFAAGTIASATVTMGRDDQANKQAAKNFAVA